MKMDAIKGKGLIAKTWERCKSIGRGRKSSSKAVPVIVVPLHLSLTKRSKSWPSRDARLELEEEKRGKKGRVRVAPQGCFSVYVGPQKQRFVIKTEYANHPLFKMLLEEAESEYGYNSQGPLALPCDVDFFCKVLMEMDGGSEEIPRGCAFVKRYGSYHILSPSPLFAINHF
ncbi:hypothetical protein L6164_015059 [Bauhinia variegata]|uniref:Uncharacterized protein n=1 Tax=Bauhinia variegata TaxID=167791 RepID=A0ACB9NLD1_BAUVA|nr:hypothetical protein L6164_015059 [Bauhinia variegata]